ncbi:hypothetical protein [Klebsiella pneumoniae IS43]|uniref:Uncharacterized protein n=1 Tax=Klebsiella pneumoniae IS43 TaxID=1432552 RepID=W1DMK7_KLEPN|nr:hypothetical protein [Klebsiella pneumoniae IS43]
MGGGDRRWGSGQTLFFIQGGKVVAVGEAAQISHFGNGHLRFA